MKRLCVVLTSIALLALASASFSQSDDHLSPAEVNAVIDPAWASQSGSKAGVGYAYISDMDSFTVAGCTSQVPEILLYTPNGWLNEMSYHAHKQYLKFEPQLEDTLRALTIVGKGCAKGTAAGPQCSSVTRTVLLSDAQGTVVIEAIASHPVTESWQNGFGATAVCASLLSRFSLSDVQKVRNSKGEFLVATFSGTKPLKTYTVKEKYLKRLGL